MSLTLTKEPKQLVQEFHDLKTARDIADLLDVKYSVLVYHIYKLEDTRKYTTFNIPKRSGGFRQITAPASSIKIIQRKLNSIFTLVYMPKPCVQGFITNKNIVTNALLHRNKKYVLNIDLQGFFPSINFGRVRGMLMAFPYYCNKDVATVLAQICCFDNKLPQGAPTSPIVSNMICAKMDSQLQLLAKINKCFYSRYADDITFSTSLPGFPYQIAIVDKNNKIIIGNELKQIIDDNGFTINEGKSRLKQRYQRQEVTGLTTNKFPNVRRRYIRQIRAMLHAWRKFRIDLAQKEFMNKYHNKHRNPALADKPISFARVVKGKIEFLGMVRGKNDKIYKKFLRQLKVLDPSLVKDSAIAEDVIFNYTPLIITEGKSDWKHLKSAFLRLKAEGKYEDLNIEFNEFHNDKGDSQLRNQCRYLSATNSSRPNICIFDRDNWTILQEISEKDHNYKCWGNNVFSFAIPIPDHRISTPDISIEYYYKDDEITREDSNSRRLYLASEFNEKSGRHEINDKLNCNDRNKFKHEIGIIDNSVFNETHHNIALPKDEFASNVMNGVDNFNNFDITAFTKIFDVIMDIISKNYREKS